MTRTRDEQTQSLANFLPEGRPWTRKNSSDAVSRGLLAGLSGELLRVEATLQEYREEILPDETILFLDEWEAALGIPDDCFTGQGTDDERRRDVLAKLVSLGVQTAEDLRLLALSIYNIAVTISNPPVAAASEFPWEFPFTFGTGDVESKFTILVNFDSLPVASRFPYTFPFEFLTRDVGTIECLFIKLKPANVAIVFTSEVPS